MSLKMPNIELREENYVTMMSLQQLPPLLDVYSMDKWNYSYSMENDACRNQSVL